MPAPEPQRNTPAPAFGRDLELGRLVSTFSNEERSKLVKFFRGLPGGPGANMEDLERLLREVPQVKDGILRYLVSGGFAVELATGTVRPHKDIDLVVISGDGFPSFRCGVYLDTVQPKGYFAHMTLDGELLTQTAREVHTRPGKSGVLALIVHPALVLIQKTSSFYGRSPRYKDSEDAVELAKLAKSECRDKELRFEWKKLLKQGLESRGGCNSVDTLHALEKALTEAGASKKLQAFLLPKPDRGGDSGLYGDLPPFPNL